jgi:hypothetical protein
MRNGMTSRAHFAALVFATCILLAATGNAQVDDPNRDNTLELFPPGTGPHPSPNTITVVSSSDGYDNPNLGVDFAEPHMSTNPLNPLWWFNAFNTNGTHHSEDGHDWTTNNPSVPSAAGDPVTAYLGTSAFEKMVRQHWPTKFLPSTNPLLLVREF